MFDLSRITVVCFTASYALALVLEAFALRGQLRGVIGRGRRLLKRGITLAGIFAHATHLLQNASGQAIPLSSPADWWSLAALVLAVIYFAGSLSKPRWSIGLFLLPIVLLLIGVSRTASGESFTSERASFFWGQTHGVLLLLATVTVTVGFVSGLMYLVQSWRLKRKRPLPVGMQLPSLEWLERTNGRSLAISVWLVAGGFLSGLVLSTLKNRAAEDYSLWTDPVVLTLAAMLAWLLVTEAYRLLSPTASRGQKVAYLTLAAFVLLAMTLGSLTLSGSRHGTKAISPQPQAEAGGLSPLSASPVTRP